jgi:hypothetical protein
MYRNKQCILQASDTKFLLFFISKLHVFIINAVAKKRENKNRTLYVKVSGRSILYSIQRTVGRSYMQKVCRNSLSYMYKNDCLLLNQKNLIKRYDILLLLFWATVVKLKRYSKIANRSNLPTAFVVNSCASV